MEFNRKLALVVGAFVLFFLGWLGYINFRTPIPQKIEESIAVPVTEMTQLQNDLTQYISDKFKKEKKNCELLGLTLEVPQHDGPDKVRVPYLLSYKDNKAETTASVQAVAMLEKTKEELWKVTKVTPQKEVITYEENNSVIKADGKSAAAKSDD